MSKAILTNNDIALIMELYTDNNGAPGFWDSLSEVYGRSAKQLRSAMDNARRNGMYKREP